MTNKDARSPPAMHSINMITTQRPLSRTQIQFFLKSESFTTRCNSLSAHKHLENLFHLKQFQHQRETNTFPWQTNDNLHNNSSKVCNPWLIWGGGALKKKLNETITLAYPGCRGRRVLGEKAIMSLCLQMGCKFSTCKHE